jgi:hypothetical protein
MRLRPVRGDHSICYTSVEHSCSKTYFTGFVIVGGQMTCGKYGGSSAGTNR